MAHHQRLLTPRTRALFWLNGALLALLVGLSALLYRWLPARYPIHFDIAGQPNRWASGTSPEWFLLPLFGLLVTGSSLALGLILPRIPLARWNLPQKEQLLALPAERQLPLRQELQAMLLWLGLVETLFFLLLQGAVFLTATGRQLVPLLALIGLATAALLGTIGYWVVRLLRLIERLLQDPPQ